MISGKTLMMIIKAAKTDGVIFTTSEERAKTLRVFAEEVCNAMELNTPEICVAPKCKSTNDGFSTNLIVFDYRIEGDVKAI
jgi:hypothetical protein